jgi:hypothetical protein
MENYIKLKFLPRLLISFILFFEQRPQITRTDASTASQFIHILNR